jgi:hypothetical protein
MACLADVGLEGDRTPPASVYLVGDTLGGPTVIEPVDRH